MLKILVLVGLWYLMGIVVLLYHIVRLTTVALNLMGDKFVSDYNVAIVKFNQHLNGTIRIGQADEVVEHLLKETKKEIKNGWVKLIVKFAYSWPSVAVRIEDAVNKTIEEIGNEYRMTEEGV